MCLDISVRSNYNPTGSAHMLIQTNMDSKHANTTIMIFFFNLDNSMNLW